jgi:hypothetical protein
MFYSDTIKNAWVETATGMIMLQVWKKKIVPCTITFTIPKKKK